MTNNSLKSTTVKITATMVGTIICYIGVALTAYADIGQVPTTAFFKTISILSGISIGLLSIICWFLFFIGQIVIERRDFKPIQFFQLLVITLGGSVFDFFYDIMQKYVVLPYYPIKLITSVLGIAVTAFGVIIIMETKILRVPLEGFSEVLAQRIGSNLGVVRQAFDVLFLLLTIIITLIASTEWTIREITVINAIIFGPLLNLYKKPVAKILYKLHVIEDPLCNLS